MKTGGRPTCTVYTKCIWKGSGRRIVDDEHDDEKDNGHPPRLELSVEAEDRLQTAIFRTALLQRAPRTMC